MSLLQKLPASARMPVMFGGHGSPMNAIEDNVFRRTWQSLGKSLSRPQAILSVSAHWLTRGGTAVGVMEKPKTIHDFSGFPRELYEQSYHAPGAPEYAEAVRRIVTEAAVESDSSWGLDHGTWSVLKPMFPRADVPVFQLSIDFSKPPKHHYTIGRQLAPLRDHGVLIVGSGNIVHNLGELDFDAAPADWAIEFDAKVAACIDKGDHEGLIAFDRFGQLGRRAHPSYDHYLPLLYALGATTPGETLTYFNAGYQGNAISMRSVLWG